MVCIRALSLEFCSFSILRGWNPWSFLSHYLPSPLLFNCSHALRAIPISRHKKKTRDNLIFFYSFRSEGRKQKSLSTYCFPALLVFSRFISIFEFDCRYCKKPRGFVHSNWRETSCFRGLYHWVLQLLSGI